MTVKIRAKFAKKEQVKFISHLDLMNTLTRALRRARIPIGFSQGYNPRPLVSFGSALAVGMTSSCEYADFELKTEYSLKKFRQDLNAELPPGIEILQTKEVPSGVKSLMSQINTAKYEIKLKFTNQINKQRITEVLRDFLDLEEVMIVRKRRNKSDRKFNLRPMVFGLKLLDVIDKQRVLIAALIQTGSSGNLRPQELVRALQQRYPISENFNLTDVHRSGLYVKKSDKLFTLFEIALE